MWTPTIELPIPGWASLVGFLLAEIEEKEKKRVGMVSKRSPIVAWPWKGLPKRTFGMP